MVSHSSSLRVLSVLLLPGGISFNDLDLPPQDSRRTNTQNYHLGLGKFQSDTIASRLLTSLRQDWALHPGFSLVKVFPLLFGGGAKEVLRRSILSCGYSLVGAGKTGKKLTWLFPFCRWGLGGSKKITNLFAYLLRIMQIFFFFGLTVKLQSYWFQIAVLSTKLHCVRMVLLDQPFTEMAILL